MQSEEFDKKVKEAADHHHPSYDEKAWQKMEGLLNKHLPEKKDDRRRFIFFLLLFLLTGGGVYLMIAKPWQSNKPVVISENPQNGSVNTINAKDAGNSEEINNKNTVGTKSLVTGETVKLEDKKQPSISIGNKKLQIRKTKQAVTKAPFSLQENEVIVNTLKGNEAVQKNNKPKANNDPGSYKDVADNNITVNAATKNIETNKSTNDQKLNTSVGADSDPKNTNLSDPIAKKAKPNNKKGNSFFLSLSTGPDISFAGLEHLGKTKLLAGAGIGYTFKNKFTLRTGFYTGRKIYSAQPYQYHVTGSQWYGNYKLERVDADCKVYEIPILLSYNFSRSAKQSWFATTGISSYLMKRETYDYLYKNSSGQTHTYEWTLKDKNKHYFSVLTVSGGYQRKINNTFSIMAEPYMKIPLSGVGLGRIKLNSTGILVSVGIKLFGSDKTKNGK